MNTQRRIVYGDRRRILEGESLRDRAVDMVGEVIQGMVAEYVSPEVFPEDWDLEGLLTQIHLTYPSDLTIADLKPVEDAFELSEKVLGEALEAYEKREAEVGDETMRELERMVFMSIIDNLWREHLQEMDYLQEGIGLRAYGQRDPLVEYQNEAHAMFEGMKASMVEEFVRYIYRVEVVREDEPSRPRPQRMVAEHGDRQRAASPGAATSGKVPRNAPCPCGSGKKYKKCHGAA